jgi:hypothetical protein
LLAEARYLLSIQTPDQPLAHLACCSVDVVDPSQALKQLMHEADHLSVFCVEVTDGEVVTVLVMNVFMLYTATALPFSVVL